MKMVCVCLKSIMIKPIYSKCVPKKTLKLNKDKTVQLCEV